MFHTNTWPLVRILWGEVETAVVNFANILNQNLKSDEHDNIDYVAGGNFVVFLNLCQMKSVKYDFTDCEFLDILWSK